MSVFRVLARNAVSNWVGFVVQAALAFALTPFVLRALGDAQYGVWMLIVGLTGYYGLLDLGFRAGLTQYLSRYLALKDYDRLNQTASTGLVALAGCGLLILLGCVLLAWGAPLAFNLPPGSESEVQLAILILGGSVAVQFAFFPFSAVFTATQRFDLSNLIGISTRLATAAATFACLHAGYGLVGISVVTAAGNLLDYLLRWRVAYRLLPELRVSSRLATWGACREFMTFGLWNVLILGSVKIIGYSSSLLIGLFLTAAAITPFALAVSLSTYFNDLFAPIGYVFFPAATKLDAEGDRAALRRLYLVGSRILLLLAVGAGLIAGFWAADFYRLWIGPEQGETPALLFRVLLVAAVCTAGQRISYQVLLATRRVRQLALLFACEAGLNLLLSILLIGHYGLLGVAIGTLIPAVLFQALVQPLVVCRQVGVSGREYAREVLYRPLAVGVTLAAALIALRQAGAATGWLALLGQGGLALVIAAILVACVGLEKEERERFVWAPLRRLFRVPQASRER